MKINTITYLPQEVLIVGNDEIISIPYIEIRTVTCDRPYIIVKTINKKYQLAQILTGFCTKLPAFITQCNKSCYINLLHVSSIQKNRCGYEANILGVSYPIARRRIDEIKENFLKIKTEITETGFCNVCVKCKVTDEHTFSYR